MIKKLLFTGPIFLLFFLETSAQAAKSVFIEGGGNGLFLSINYDTRVSKKENGLGIRAGIGFFPDFNLAGFVDVSNFISFPIGLNYLAGKGPHYFEGGAGLTIATARISIGSSEQTGTNAVFVPSAGYRFAKGGKGFQARLFISPLIGSGGGIFWAGGSVGYKF